MLYYCVCFFLLFCRFPHDLKDICRFPNSTTLGNPKTKWHHFLIERSPQKSCESFCFVFHSVLFCFLCLANVVCSILFEQFCSLQTIYVDQMSKCQNIVSFPAKFAQPSNYCLFYHKKTITVYFIIKKLSFMFVFIVEPWMIYFFITPWIIVLSLIYIYIYI